MREPNIDLSKVLELFDEFRDRIYEQNSGHLEIEHSLYSIVAMKLFGFAFNTYKAIGLLLPQHSMSRGARSIERYGRQVRTSNGNLETRSCVLISSSTLHLLSIATFFRSVLGPPSAITTPTPSSP